jgi:hypothetical protein
MGFDVEKIRREIVKFATRIGESVHSAEISIPELDLFAPFWYNLLRLIQAMM